MSDELKEMQAENERLRDLLLEHGINPEPALLESPRFGPPTELEWQMWQMAAAHFAEVNVHFAQMAAEAGPATVRIRLPNSFTQSS